MSFKSQLILALVFMQIRSNFCDISYLSERQKNNFQFLPTHPTVICFTMHPASFTHNFLCLGDANFFFQDTMVLQACHEK